MQEEKARWSHEIGLFVVAAILRFINGLNARQNAAMPLEILKTSDDQMKWVFVSPSRSHSSYVVIYYYCVTA